MTSLEKSRAFPRALEALQFVPRTPSSTRAVHALCLAILANSRLDEEEIREELEELEDPAVDLFTAPARLVRWVIDSHQAAAEEYDDLMAAQTEEGREPTAGQTSSWFTIEIIPHLDELLAELLGDWPALYASPAQTDPRRI